MFWLNGVTHYYLKLSTVKFFEIDVCISVFMLVYSQQWFSYIFDDWKTMYSFSIFIQK